MQLIAYTIEDIYSIDKTGSAVSHCFASLIYFYSLNHLLQGSKGLHNLFGTACAIRGYIDHHIGTCYALVTGNSIDGFSMEELSELRVYLKQFLSIERSKLISFSNCSDGFIEYIPYIIHSQLCKQFHEDVK